MSDTELRLHPTDHHNNQKRKPEFLKLPRKRSKYQNGFVGEKQKRLPTFSHGNSYWDKRFKVSVAPFMPFITHWPKTTDLCKQIIYEIVTMAIVRDSNRNNMSVTDSRPIVFTNFLQSLPTFSNLRIDNQ